ncbi:MAG: hypothetical protein R3B49_01525 [Phycisphaerales bacterium]
MIIWGSRIIRRRLGRVGTFCPLRRELREFEAWDIRKTTHLYFVPLGSGRRTHIQLRDPGGQAIYGLTGEPFQGYVSPRDAMTPLELAQATRPEAIEEAHDALERDEAAAAAPEMSDERLGALVERISAGEYAYVLGMRSGSSESISAVLAFVTIGLLATGVVAWHQGSSWWAWALVPGALLLPAVIYRAVVTSKRSGWTRIEAMVVESMATLAPSRDEVHAAVALARQGGVRVAGIIRPDDFAGKIERALVPGA